MAGQRLAASDDPVAALVDLKSLTDNCHLRLRVHQGGDPLRSSLELTLSADFAHCL